MNHDTSSSDSTSGTNDTNGNQPSPPPDTETNGVLIVAPEDVEIFGSLEDGNLEVYLAGMPRQESLTINFQTQIGDMAFSQIVCTGPDSGGEQFFHEMVDTNIHALGPGTYQLFVGKVAEL